MGLGANGVCSPFPRSCIFTGESPHGPPASCSPLLAALDGLCQDSATRQCSLSSAPGEERGTALRKEPWTGVGQEGKGAAQPLSCPVLRESFSPACSTENKHCLWDGKKPCLLFRKPHENQKWTHGATLTTGTWVHPCMGMAGFGGHFEICLPHHKRNC